MANSDVVSSLTTAKAQPVSAVPAPILKRDEAQAEAQAQAQEYQAMAEQVADISGGKPVPPTALSEQIDPATGTLVPSPLMMLANTMPPAEEQGAQAPAPAPAPEQQKAAAYAELLKFATETRTRRKRDMVDALVWERAPARPKPEPRRTIKRRKPKSKKTRVMLAESTPSPEDVNEKDLREKSGNIGRTVSKLLGRGARRGGAAAAARRASKLHRPPSGLQDTAQIRPGVGKPATPDTKVLPRPRNRSLDTTVVRPDVLPSGLDTTFIGAQNPLPQKPSIFQSSISGPPARQTPFPARPKPEGGISGPEVFRDPKYLATLGMGGAAVMPPIYMGVKAAPQIRESIQDQATQNMPWSPEPPAEGPSLQPSNPPSPARTARPWMPSPTLSTMESPLPTHQSLYSEKSGNVRDLLQNVRDRWRSYAATDKAQGRATLAEILGMTASAGALTGAGALGGRGLARLTQDPEQDEEEADNRARRWTGYGGAMGLGSAAVGMTPLLWARALAPSGAGMDKVGNAYDFRDLAPMPMAPAQDPDSAREEIEAEVEDRVRDQEEQKLLLLGTLASGLGYAGTHALGLEGGKADALRTLFGAGFGGLGARTLAKITEDQEQDEDTQNNRKNRWSTAGALGGGLLGLTSNPDTVDRMTGNGAPAAAPPTKTLLKPPVEAPKTMDKPAAVTLLRHKRANSNTYSGSVLTPLAGSVLGANLGESLVARPLARMTEPSRATDDELKERESKAAMLGMLGGGALGSIGSLKLDKYLFNRLVSGTGDMPTSNDLIANLSKVAVDVGTRARTNNPTDSGP